MCHIICTLAIVFLWWIAMFSKSEVPDQKLHSDRGHFYMWNLHVCMGFSRYSGFLSSVCRSLWCRHTVPDTCFALISTPAMAEPRCRPQLGWPIVLSRPPLTLSQHLVKHLLLSFTSSPIFGVTTIRRKLWWCLSAENGCSFHSSPFPLFIWISELNFVLKEHVIPVIWAWLGFEVRHMLFLLSSEEVDGWYNDIYDALKNRPHKFVTLEVHLHLQLCSSSCF